MRSNWPTWIRVVAVSLCLAGCDGLRAWLIRVYPQDWEEPSGAKAAPGQVWPAGVPLFDGPDAGSPRIPIHLTPVAKGIGEPTDIQFLPGSSDQAIVLQKGGAAIRVDLVTGAKTEILRIEVPTKSEQGLLGWAFHPQWNDNGRVFLNHSQRVPDGVVSRVSEWRVDPRTWSAQRMGTVLEVVQPYGNHNAGQLAFGPDGYLYIGWGDGGWRGDPGDNGQNPRTWLGSMLRIDIDDASEDKVYSIPADNPFVGRSDGSAEVWAIGLRNPWRYSFAPDGRLIVADVGQDAWEEIAIVAAGENHGWNRREGRHCYPPKNPCGTAGMTDPVFEYGHASGESITGGFVYTGVAVPALKGKYIFADFVSGRFWAIDLPAAGQAKATGHVALGRWPTLPSTFGQAANGEVYVAGFSNGIIFRIDSARPAVPETGG
jgi:glucose/arabinose dehydrogenase